MVEKPLVSIVIRTCDRPVWAMEAVRSALSQTYDSVEVILIDDGPPLCGPYVKDLDVGGRIEYRALGQNRGRSLAGNEGLKLARGDYINFLDDDDLLFPDHVESLVTALGGRIGIAYAGWELARTEVLSTDPLRLRERQGRERFSIPFNKISLWVSNFIPIQAVMFHRTFYDQLGGLDPTLDAFEDWELWCRYSTRSEFQFVPKTTSVCRIPHGKSRKGKRDATYTADWAKAQKKVESLPFTMDGFDTDTFLRFFEHYAIRNKLIKVGKRTRRILQLLRAGRDPTN